MVKEIPSEHQVPTIEYYADNEGDLVDSATDLYPDYYGFRVATYVGNSVVDDPNYPLENGEEVVADENGNKIEFFGTNLPDFVEHKALVAKRKSGN